MQALFGMLMDGICEDVIIIDHGGAIDHKVGHAGEEPAHCETTYLCVMVSGGSTGSSGWYCSKDIHILRPAEEDDWPASA